MPIKNHLRLYTHNTVNILIALDDRIEYYDLTFIYNGNICYTVNGKDYFVKSGDVVYIPPGSHRKREISEADDNIHYCSINFFSSEDYNLPLHMPKAITSDIKQMLVLLEHTVQQRYNRREEKISLLLELLCTTLADESERQNQNPHVISILEYIYNNYRKPITLNSIAAHVSLTPTYCSYLIRHELGVNISDIIMKERISLAQNYILQNEKSLQEICFLCGFNDYCYFSKQFKKVTHYTPLDYRKNNSLLKSITGIF